MELAHVFELDRLESGLSCISCVLEPPGEGGQPQEYVVPLTLSLTVGIAIPTSLTLTPTLAVYISDATSVFDTP